MAATAGCADGGGRGRDKGPRHGVVVMLVATVGRKGATAGDGSGVGGRGREEGLRQEMVVALDAGGCYCRR